MSTALEMLDRVDRRTQRQIDEAMREYCRLVEKHVAPIIHNIQQYKIPKLLFKNGNLVRVTYEYTETEQKLLDQAEELRKTIARELNVMQPKENVSFPQ